MTSGTVALWKHPDLASTQVDVFRRHLCSKYGLTLATYADLHRWSTEDVGLFSRELLDFCHIKCSVPPSQNASGLHQMHPRPQWFPGAKLNYTENLLCVGLASSPASIAVSACRGWQTGWNHLTWIQLQTEAARWTSALRRAGIKKGDRVVSCMTNCIECLLIFMAAGAIGAIFSSASPDMGADSIVERYCQVRPKIIFVETKVVYAGKTLDLRTKMGHVATKLRGLAPELEKVVVVGGLLCDGINVQDAKEFLKGDILPLKFEQLDFDHPIYILYSSGTTGKPKCICHSAGGALLQQKKEHVMTSHLGLDSCYYQYTTTGWMMWNYMVSALSCGSRIVLYDGSPMHPSPAYQLEILEEQKVTVWGTSPKFLTSLKAQSRPLSLENLQYVMSVGAPLNPEIYHWFYNYFPKNVGLFSGSGGTDLVGGIVMGSPMVAVHPGQISTAALGMKVEIWDADGKNVEQTGETGDLVITKPFLSMPLTFWGPGGDGKYFDAYFAFFPGVWCHGDFIRKDPRTGGYEVLGRSDGVLNPGGIRFGTSELYIVLDRFAEIEDSIAVGQRIPESSDEHVLLFLKLRQGIILDANLHKKICEAIRATLSARHVPAFVAQVADIPYTTNGKKVEKVVKEIVNGRDFKNSGTVVNPECLKEYSKFVRIDGLRGVWAKL